MDHFISLPEQSNVVGRTPTAQLRLYAGVPWDNSYTHVRLFESQADLLSNLESWRVLNSDARLNQMAPIRVGSLEVKVPFTEMSALDLNYLAFQNTGISSQWVFCFVTSIEWLSPQTTRVHFELDVWQNNIYRCTMKPCYVERMHIPKSQDTLGANLVPDNLETGEYICVNHTASDFGDMEICLYASTSPTGEAGNVYRGGMSNGVYRGCALAHYGTDDASIITLQTLIEEYVNEGSVDAILAFFMAPKLCVNAALRGNPGPDEKLTTISYGTPFEGYTPKNNKLYSSPYLYLIVDNNCGQSNTLFFEYSDKADHTLDINYKCTMSTTPAVLIYPKNYKGATDLYSEAISYQNFPMCAFNYDTFSSWLAYNQGTLGITAVQSGKNLLQSVAAGAGAGSLAGGVGTGVGAVAGLAGGLFNFASDVAGMLNTVYQKNLEPNVLVGKAMNTNLNAGADLQQCDFYVMSVNEQFAKIADNYWTVFGYPIHDLVTPTMHNRSSWDFLKTKGCGLTGTVDLDQLSKLRAILDNGVFIWHTNDIGNFSLENN